MHTEFARPSDAPAIAGVLREAAQWLVDRQQLDCVADRQALRTLYEGFGFTLHDCVFKGRREFARYQIVL